MSFNEYQDKDLKKVIACLMSEIEELEVQKGIDIISKIDFKKHKINDKKFITWWETFKKEHNHELLVESARKKLSEAEWDALEEYYDDKFHLGG